MGKLLNIEVTDDYVNILEKKNGDDYNTNYIHIKLRDEIVEYGIIKDEDSFIKTIKDELKENSIKSKKANFIIPEDVITIRRVHVPKGVKNYRKYFEDEHLNKLKYIVKDPIFDYVIQEQNEEEDVLIFFAMDNSVLREYYKVFKKMNIKIVKTEIFHNVIFESLSIEKQQKLNNKLILKIENHKMFKIIYENSVSIFSIVEEIKLSDSDNQIKVVFQEIMKLLNYYNYSLGKGKFISEIIIYNDTNFDESEIDKLKNEFDEKITLFAMKRETPVFAEVLTKNQYMTLAVSRMKGK